jgi:disulfide bond formation protein DsbB
MSSRWPLLVVAAIGLIAGAVKAWKVGVDALSAGLIATGLIILGAWLAMEIEDALHERKEKQHDVQ